MSNDLLEVRAPYWVGGEHDQPWPLNIHTNAYANSLIVKTGPGKLYGFSVYNSLAASQWIQLFDAATVPADGAIPATIFVAATVANLGIYFGSVGRAFNVGCVIVNSTTGPTKTIGAANCWIDAQYV